MSKSTKNGWILLLLLLAGIVLGGLLGQLAANVSWLSWLDYGKSFGINSGTPLVLDLSVMVITFGLELKLNVSAIIGIILAFVVYKKWM